MSSRDHGCTKEGAREDVATCLIGMIFCALAGVALIVIPLWFTISGTAAQPDYLLVTIFVYPSVSLILFACSWYFYREYRESKQKLKMITEEEEQERLAANQK